MSKFPVTEEHLDAAIRQHRTAQATITLSHNGSPVANQEVVVEQKNHHFLMGTNWGDSSIALANGELSGREKELAERRNDYFLRLFNQVTLPFYWGRFEPERGQPQTERIRNVARWYQEQNIALKGHPLCWHTLTADWLLSASNQEILATQIARIQRDVAAFAGLIDMWDVINEAVIMPFLINTTMPLPVSARKWGASN